MPEPSPEAVEALFQQATDLDLAQRGAFLDEQCAGDPDLRAAVEELLHFDAKAESEPDFLRSPAAEVRAGTAALAGARAPGFIGRYRILRRHGEGGMGTVYEAEQDNPRRTVALKVIRPGLVSPELLKRFSHEAQILARLQHPGIAQVYEAGIAEDGQPFFAMEFIRGMPLDEYARSHGLDAAARLELLAKVCDAVQHAHDKGVIHRDLKPGNILVDESGQPKVLDFGVAHVTAADLLTTSSRTQTGQLLGTLSYMSPEQVTADPAGLDGRSDVYTLGVILFELLAHRLPYQLDHLPVHEVARVIRAAGAVAAGLDRHALPRRRRDDRGQGARERQDAALRVGGRPGVGHPALPARGSRSWPGLPRRSISSASSRGGTRRWWPECRASSRRSWWEPSFRFSLPCVPTGERMLGWPTSGSVPPLTRATVRRIAAAIAAISHHDVADATRQLDAAPEALRDWEWRHLHSAARRQHRGVPGRRRRISVPDPRSERHPDRSLTRASLRLTDLEGSELLARSFPPEIHLIHHPPLRLGTDCGSSPEDGRFMRLLTLLYT